MIGDSGEAGVSYILCLRNMVMVNNVPITVFFFEYLFGQNVGLKADVEKQL